jgi:anthranilate phosphoribosyltransferase
MNLSDQDALNRLVNHGSFETDEMAFLMRRIMRGEMPPAVTAALLIGLRVRKETVCEVTAAARVMREFATAVDVYDRAHLVDIVGTGGDGAHTFNISTCSMFVAAACGARVSKHGNRSVSSKSGSADVLEAFGARIDLPPAEIARCIDETGVGFMFAPMHHPAMKHVAGLRKELGVRTVFNILGPLTNPASAPHVLMGVFSPDLVPIQAGALQQLGVVHAVVVHGCDGLDEVTLGGPTLVCDVKDGSSSTYELHPEEFGLTMADQEAMRVDGPDSSRALIEAVLDDHPGPARDIVAFNAGVALYAADVAPSVEDGIRRAKLALASGAARDRLQRFIVATQHRSTAEQGR